MYIPPSTVERSHDLQNIHGTILVLNNTVGKLSSPGEDFLSRQPDFFTETAVTPERKVEKSFPRWEINRHVEG